MRHHPYLNGHARGPDNSGHDLRLGFIGGLRNSWNLVREALSPTRHFSSSIGVSRVVVSTPISFSGSRAWWRRCINSWWHLVTTAMMKCHETIHQPHRLRIMAALDNDPEPLDFATLKAISGATDGNLGAHLQTLEKAGLIAISKEVIGRRNRTWASLTVSGRQAFREHVSFLEDIIHSTQTMRRT